MGNVLDMTAREEQSFSFARAIQSQLNGTRGFEQEVSEELYKKTGRKRTNPNAILVPTQRLGRYAFANQTRAMAVATSGAGQQLKFTEYGGFLDLLRNKMYLGQLGAVVLSGLQGDVGFVTMPSANTFQWGAETAAATATNFGTGLKTLAPKDGSALTAYTRRLMAQSVESIEGLVQNDLMKIIALAIDAAGISGSGSTQPTGIISTSGIGSVTMGTAGAVPTFPKLIDMETEIVTDNADSERMAYLSTPGIRGYLKKTEEFSATSGRPIWTTQNGVGYVNGFPAFASNQVPSNGTKGSNTGTNHTILFGDFSNVVIGEWGAIELIVDPYSAKSTIIEVGAHVMVDVMLRYPEGLCAMVDARTS
jgi:HK97 family phage major capsid protein